jgi:cell division protein ZapA
MPLVNVMINGRAYTLGCDEGEEDHLKELAGLVDAKAREALSMVGPGAGDVKMMLMAALLLADEHHDATHQLAAGAQVASAQAETKSQEREILQLRAEQAESDAADVLEHTATRLEAIAARLARA